MNNFSHCSARNKEDGSFVTESIKITYYPSDDYLDDLDKGEEEDNGDDDDEGEEEEDADEDEDRAGENKGEVEMRRKKTEMTMRRTKMMTTTTRTTKAIAYQRRATVVRSAASMLNQK